MNYKKQYQLLIAKHGSLTLPKEDEYYERHHILPKSAGGSNDWYNLVYLTARCHLVAHALLAKWYNTPELKTAYALMCMVGKYKVTGRQYEAARKAVSGKNSILAKPLMTPLGSFDTVREAARAHNTSSAVISAKLKSSYNTAYKYTKEENVEKHGIRGNTSSNHPIAKGVYTPDGYFGSVRQAATHYNVHHKTIHRWCLGDNEGYSKREGFTLVVDDCAIRPMQAKRKVHTPLGWFDSVAMAARAHGVGGAGTISTRCKAGWPEYYYSD